MGMLTTRLQLSQCSLCARKVQRHTSMVSLNTWTRGWHRSFRLCASCTHALSLTLDELKKMVRE